MFVLFNPSGTNDTHKIDFEIEYTGSWSGAITLPSSSQSIDGTGYKKYYSTQQEGSIVVMSAQKQDGSNSKITVNIYQDDKLVKLRKNINICH